METIKDILEPGIVKMTLYIPETFEKKLIGVVIDDNHTIFGWFGCVPRVNKTFIFNCEAQSIVCHTIDFVQDSITLLWDLTFKFEFVNPDYIGKYPISEQVEFNLINWSK